MKIRIQDNSIRFRLTIKEAETLAREGRLERRTEIPAPPGICAVFSYAVAIDEDAGESCIRLGPTRIEFVLNAEDARELSDPTREGVYVRREWLDESATTKRFIAFVEKDRPGSSCVKPEEWIYDAEAGRPVRTVPIPRPG